MTLRIKTLGAFRRFFSADESGFAFCHWNEDPAHKAKFKEELNFTGEPSPRRVIFAKSY